MNRFHTLNWENQPTPLARAQGKWLWHNGRVRNMVQDENTVLGVVLDERVNHVKIVVSGTDFDEFEGVEPEEDEDASGFFGMDASATEPPDIGDLPEDDPDDGFDFLTRDDEDEEYEDGEDEDEDEDGDGEDELLPLFSWACTCTRDSREMCPHVVALLSALDDRVEAPDSQPYDTLEPAKEPDLDTLLSNMKRGDLRNLMAVLAKSDPLIRERVVAYQSRQLPPTQDTAWSLQLQEMMTRHLLLDPDDPGQDPYGLAVELNQFLNANILFLLDMERNGGESGGKGNDKGKNRGKNAGKEKSADSSLLMRAFRLIAIAYEELWNYADRVADSKSGQEDDEEEEIWDWNSGLLDDEEEDEEGLDVDKTLAVSRTYFARILSIF